MMAYSDMVIACSRSHHLSIHSKFTGNRPFCNCLFWILLGGQGEGKGTYYLDRPEMKLSMVPCFLFLNSRPVFVIDVSR